MGVRLSVSALPACFATLLRSRGANRSASIAERVVRALCLYVFFLH